MPTFLANRTATAWVTAVALVGAAAADAAAQSAAAPPAAAASAASAASSASAGYALDAVVVTSQKRREDIGKVPLSVSAISGEALQADHITNFTDLTRAVPNVSFSTQAGAGLATIEIRGLSSQAGTATVSVYLDETSLTTRNLYSQGTAEPRFFDIDRVEVLRGPQGTLYGASSLGGTIRFISRQPEATSFYGDATAEVSGTKKGGTNYLLEGVVNVPLVPSQIALRIGLQHGRDSGYIDHVDLKTLEVDDKNINSAHWDTAKVALKAQIADGWSVTPALFAQRYVSDDIDASYLAVGDYQPVNAGVPLGRFQTSKIVREPGKDKLTVPSLTVNGDLGFGDVVGVVAGYKRRFGRTQDGTSINSSYIGSVVTDGALGATVGALPSEVQLDNKIDQTSVELRIASKDRVPGGVPLTWIGGAYYAKTKTQVFDNEPVFGINDAFKAAGKNIEDPLDLADAFPNDFPNDSSYYSARHYVDRQKAVFGELTWHLSDTLRALAGVRYSKTTQHFTREGDYYFAGGPTTADIDSDAHATTPRLSLSWDVDPATTTLYANVAKGFRFGGANRPVPDTAAVRQDLAALGLPGAPPPTLGPDSAWSYELGAKSRLLDNRLSLSAAAFFIDWKDIQQDVTLPVSGYDFETNVGRAHSRGVEFEARFRATDALTLDAAAGYTRATFTDDVPALGTDDSGAYNVRKGDRIQGVPKYNARLGFDWRFPVLATSQGFVRGSGQWTGTSHGSFFRGATDHERPAYFTADVSTGLDIDRWRVAVFVKNLTDNHKALQRPDIQSVSEAYTLRPRTIGLTASTAF